MFNKTLIIVTFLIAAAVPTLSFGHAKVLKTSPANEAVLQTSPEKITLTFPEALKVTSFKLENENGDEVSVEGGKSLTPTKEINATPPELHKGTYNVKWRGLSSDGHPIKGHFNFTIAP
ncbi:copper resistance CopC family protein [Kiloniella sp.]|uniref:copper resistance CopC family protein n=1 Tax=Kiloniella sp. TaxID=1938587 RepID=UPI003B02C3D1